MNGNSEMPDKNGKNHKHSTRLAIFVILCILVLLLVIFRESISEYIGMFFGRINESQMSTLVD